MAVNSKKRHEGYLQIDHRFSPGITAEDLAKAGVQGIPVPSGENFETATITCHHCQKVNRVNPKRTRPRGYCAKCDHYVCDFCEGIRVKTGECNPFIKIIDQLHEAQERSLSSTPLVMLATS